MKTDDSKGVKKTDDSKSPDDAASHPDAEHALVTISGYSYEPASASTNCNHPQTTGEIPVAGGNEDAAASHKNLGRR